MSYYTAGTFGKVKVGTKVSYIYGLNLMFDRLDLDGEPDDPIDLNDIEFNDNKPYRCGKGIVTDIRNENEYHMEYQINDEWISDGTHMVIGTGGKSEFIKHIDAWVYPIKRLQTAIKQMKEYRANMIKFANTNKE